MRRTLSIATSVLCMTSLSALGFYEQGAQRLLAFTGNIHAKVVWVRTSDCKDKDYTSNSVLVAMDTREGGARVLDNVVGVHIWPKITRDGQYVIWNVGPEEYSPTTSAWIIRWDGTGKKRLIDGSQAANPGHVLSTWVDGAGQQYVFASKATTDYENDNAVDQVYRIPLNGDAVDLTRKQLVYNKSRVTPVSFNVSSDGKYTATNCPWPLIARYNFQNQTLDTVCRDPEEEACMPYIAPDASGWLTHMEITHRQIETVSPDNRTRTWINCSQGMPGNRGRYDVLNPMWSNHAMFLSAMYPLLNCSSTMRGEFCVGKYRDNTYKAIDWICVTDTTQTSSYREGLGDLWLEGVATQTNPGSQPARSGVGAIAVGFGTSGLVIDVSGSDVHSVDIVAPSGRMIRTFSGRGCARYGIAAAGLSRGVYLVVLRTGARVATKTISHNGTQFGTL